MTKTTFPRHFKPARVAAFALAFLVVGCSEGVYDEIELMPAPVVYSAAKFDPFPASNTPVTKEETALFYVTDRAPAGPEDKQLRYTNQRGQLSRVGVAEVALSPTVQNWDQFRQITLYGNRDRKYLLNVSGVNEIGVMPYSVAELYPSPPSKSEMGATGRAFAKQVNRQLSLSRNKDVFIYIHGYNVDFEYSTLVSKELQHFLGYQGAFISYNWAATPNRFAYFKDQESASATRRNLRSLIEYLSDHTQAERINIIGYSAGSRLAFEVTYQIALQNKGSAGPRLGKVLLISSDLDRSYVAHALADGLLKAVDRLSVYLSGTDAALGMSSRIFGRDRLGQVWAEGDVWPALEQRLSELKKLEMIDVTEAESSDAGNGHWYFQSSPWASSDMFVTLLTDLPAQKRGLVRAPGEAFWTFPADYPQRISHITVQ
jgi:esterase/lipase superfamily enzyme